ncbi:MAG: transcription termination factor Rho [Planctomycetota bacterium]
MANLQNGNEDVTPLSPLPSEARSAEIVDGVFELARDIGWLRKPNMGYRPKRDDVQVLANIVQQYGLRGGELVVGTIAPLNGGNAARRVLSTVSTINNLEAAAYVETKPFEELTAIDPHERLRFEIPGGSPSMRVVDLLTPIGLGQRGLIAAPPRSGKTILLQQIAAGISANHPDIYMMVLLIDERPEEVTHMQRTVHGEVVASCNDHDATAHVRLAKFVIQRAKRLVECKQNVVILLDSLTRLGRAFNTEVRGGGKIMSGGIDSRALAEPKAIFGAARKVEHGGSLTIIASALIETGSRMDEVIFNEFKGTGNMEIMLSRDLSNKRIWPAIDLHLSGTRKEEKLLSARELPVAHMIRRRLQADSPARGMEMLLENLAKYPTNAAMVEHLAPKPTK